MLLLDYHVLPDLSNFYTLQYEIQLNHRDECSACNPERSGEGWLRKGHSMLRPFVRFSSIEL